MRIRCKRDRPYVGPHVRLGPGEVREVEEGEAQRLLRTFPQWFEVAGDAVAAPETAEPGVDSVETHKAIRRPPRSKPRKARTK